MIKSMTGYGKAEVTILSGAGSKKITAEIRSLNSKQLDLAVKLPSAYRRFEYEVRASVAKAMQRGKVDVYIGTECDSAATVLINRELFTEFYRQLSDIAADNGVVPGGETLMASILRMPDVVSAQGSEISEQEQHAIMQAVTGALDAMENFRAQEGAILMADLLRRVDRIEKLKDDVTPFEMARVEAVRTKIRESIEAMSLQVDNNRLEQEMIYYIERLDVTEEKVRLSNHCNYFREVVAQEEGVGRKLGFISQEMGREINTLGSKANDSAMQRIVVEMKDELEKIKEQLLNIL